MLAPLRYSSQLRTYLFSKSKPQALPQLKTPQQKIILGKTNSFASSLVNSYKPPNIKVSWYCNKTHTEPPKIVDLEDSEIDANSFWESQEGYDPYPSSSMTSSLTYKSSHLPIDPTVLESELSEESELFPTPSPADRIVSNISEQYKYLPVDLIGDIRGKRKAVSERKTPAQTPAPLASHRPFDELFKSKLFSIYPTQEGIAIDPESQGYLSTPEFFQAQAELLRTKIRLDLIRRNLKSGMAHFRRLLELQSKVPPDLERLHYFCRQSWREILHLLVEKGSYEQLMEFMDSYQAIYGLQDKDRVVCTLNFFVYHDMLETAIQFWDDVAALAQTTDMNGVKHPQLIDERGYVLVGLGYAEKKQFDIANKYFDQAFQRIKTDPTFTCSEYLYRSAAKCYVQQRNYDLLRNLLEESLKLNLQAPFYSSVFDSVFDLDNSFMKIEPLQLSVPDEETPSISDSPIALHSIDESKKENVSKLDLLILVEKYVTMSPIRYTQELQADLFKLKLFIAKDFESIIKLSAQYCTRPDQTTLNVIVSALLNREAFEIASQLIDDWKNQFGIYTDEKTNQIIYDSLRHYLEIEKTNLPALFEQYNELKIQEWKVDGSRINGRPKSQTNSLAFRSGINSRALRLYESLVMKRDDIKLIPQAQFDIFFFAYELESYLMANPFDRSGKPFKVEKLDGIGDDDDSEKPNLNSRRFRLMQQLLTYFNSHPLASLPWDSASLYNLIFNCFQSAKHEIKPSPYFWKECHRLNQLRTEKNMPAVYPTESLSESYQKYCHRAYKLIGHEIARKAMQELPYPASSGIYALVMNQFFVDEDYYQLVKLWYKAVETGNHASEFLTRVYSRYLTTRSIPNVFVLNFLKLVRVLEVPMTAHIYKNVTKLYYIIGPVHWNPKEFWELELLRRSKRIPFTLYTSSQIALVLKTRLRQLHGTSKEADPVIKELEAFINNEKAYYTSPLLPADRAAQLEALIEKAVQSFMYRKTDLPQSDSLVTEMAAFRVRNEQEIKAQHTWTKQKDINFRRVFKVHKERRATYER